MEGDFIKVNNWLLPLSWVYGGIVRLRNLLFDIGILKSRTFDVPIISVGNITVGGTGKTPHVEYLIDLLKDKANVAVISRGYKRKSKGFVLANKNSKACDIGDEPYQMLRKYPNITVAVDKSRTHAIEMLGQQDKKIDAILLDDAFQHRYVKPGINILLVDYHRLITYDKLLPAGRLREPLSGKNRADIVVVTKCPKTLSPMEYRVLTKAMDLYPYQELFFSTFEYDALKPVFINKDKRGPKNIEQLKNLNVLLVTGIASPRQMIEDLKPLTASLTSISFPDHHHFSKNDADRINETFAELPSPKCIVTTEKDAARLVETTGLSKEVRQRCYALTIKVQFMLEQEDIFNEKIIGYVRKDSRNSILAKEKDECEPENSDHTGDGPRTISFRNI